MQKLIYLEPENFYKGILINVQTAGTPTIPWSLSNSCSPGKCGFKSVSFSATLLGNLVLLIKNSMWIILFMYCVCMFALARLAVLTSLYLIARYVNCDCYTL